MRSIDELIESAEELTNNGLSRGEIADELNISRETAQWLVNQQGETGSSEGATSSPTDVHIDWSAIGQNSHRMSHLGSIMADIIPEPETIELMIGVGNSGAPLATVISQELGTKFSGYVPSKYQSDEDANSETGSFSRNFAVVADMDCCIVDDNIDTGRTMAETIERLRENGCNPRSAVVLTDKHGEDKINGVPVYSLIQMVQMQRE
jgi:orotate phosphoribosyltransferase